MQVVSIRLIEIRQNITFDDSRGLMRISHPSRLAAVPYRCVCRMFAHGDRRAVRLESCAIYRLTLGHFKMLSKYLFSNHAGACHLFVVYKADAKGILQFR